MATYRIQTTFEITADVEFTVECDGLAREFRDLVNTEIDELKEKLDVSIHHGVLVVTDITNDGWHFDRVEDED